jgi:seryl-tRNA synthetase
MIQLKNNNYCTPLTLFILGERSCNKTIYKTVTDEMQDKLKSVYSDINENAKELKEASSKKEIKKMELKAKEVNQKLEYQNMFISVGKTVEELKDSLRKINNAYIDNVKNLREVYNLLEKITSKTAEDFRNSLGKISYLISLCYITPSLHNMADPLLKIYSAIADYLKEPTKPHLLINKKTNLSASLAKSKQLFYIKN